MATATTTGRAAGRRSGAAMPLTPAAAHSRHGGARWRGIFVALIATAGINLLLFFSLAALNQPAAITPPEELAPRRAELAPPPAPPRPLEKMTPPDTRADNLALPDVDVLVVPPALDVQVVTRALPHLAVAAPIQAPRIAKPTVTVPVPVERVTQVSRGPMQSDEVDQDARVVSFAKPDYPALARRRRMEGSVTVKILINTRGRVEQVKVVECRGADFFAREVTKVAKTWRFEPAQHQGNKVSVWGIRTIKFRLED